MTAAPAITPTKPATTPTSPLTPIIFTFSPAAPLDVAAVMPDDTDALMPPDELDAAPPPLLLGGEVDAEVGTEADEETDEEAPEAEAEMADEALASRLDRGGSEMELVAEPRLTETEPEVTAWFPHRADWSCSDVCCSSAVQLLRGQLFIARRKAR